jgi:hypothetical protein
LLRSGPSAADQSGVPETPTKEERMSVGPIAGPGVPAVPAAKPETAEPAGVKDHDGDPEDTGASPVASTPQVAPKGLVDVQA